MESCNKESRQYRKEVDLVELEEKNQMVDNIGKTLDFYCQRELESFKQSELYKRFLALAKEEGYYVSCDLIKRYNDIILSFSLVDKFGDYVTYGEYWWCLFETCLVCVDNRIKFYSWERDEQFIFDIHDALSNSNENHDNKKHNKAKNKPIIDKNVIDYFASVEMKSFKDSLAFKGMCELANQVECHADCSIEANNRIVYLCFSIKDKNGNVLRPDNNDLELSYSTDIIRFYRNNGISLSPWIFDEDFTGDLYSTIEELKVLSNNTNY